MERYRYLCWITNDVFVTRSFSRMRGLLYVYTENTEVLAGVQALNTTMGTRANITAHHISAASVDGHGFESSWISLSRYKLDIMANHLRQKERVIWIDLDTLVFTDLSSTFRQASTWVVGWQHGKHGVDQDLISIMGRPIPSQYDSLGDLWAVDLDSIKEILDLEQSLTVKPTYDLQGYFTLLLAQGSHNFRLLQDLMPHYAFGFQCSNFEHPTSSNLDLKVSGHHLQCADKQNLTLGTLVGSISFTAPTFQALFRNGLEIADADARGCLEDWFCCEGNSKCS